MHCTHCSTFRWDSLNQELLAVAVEQLLPERLGFNVMPEGMSAKNMTESTYCTRCPAGFFFFFKPMRVPLTCLSVGVQAWQRAVKNGWGEVFNISGSVNCSSGKHRRGGATLLPMLSVVAFREQPSIMSKRRSCIAYFSRLSLCWKTEW